MSNNDIRAALEPCPFCGSEASLEDERLLWVVRCSGCGACVVGDRAPEPEQELPDSYWEPFRQSAVARWNRRPAAPWRSIPAPQQALPWPTDGPAVPESREPASVAPEATGQPRQLSPAAQAVLDAVALYPPAIAAALRVVADQVVPAQLGLMHPVARAEAEGIRSDVLAIAAELEGFNG